MQCCSAAWFTLRRLGGRLLDLGLAIASLIGDLSLPSCSIYLESMNAVLLGCLAHTEAAGWSLSRLRSHESRWFREAVSIVHCCLLLPTV